MILTPKHRLVLSRLIGTRTPITPEADEFTLFEELFNGGYLNYTYGAHAAGFTITYLGMDEITVHRQRDKL